MPPGYTDPHSWSPASAFQQVASTGLAGFALQNGTPNILTWAAPNDGQMHSLFILGMLRVTSAETGGAIASNGISPDGSTFVGFTNDAGGHASAGHFELAALYVVVGPGSTFTLAQTSALTAGAAVLWAQIWAA